MLETIATALVTHIGKKVIDSFWKRSQTGNTPAINQTGRIEDTMSREGRTFVQKAFIDPRYQDYELILGEFYMTPLSEALWSELVVPLVVVIEETTQQIVLFEADLEGGYEIELIPGIYSFYVLLVDRDASTLWDAEITALGLPSKMDLSSSEELPEDDEDLLDFVDESPREITPGGPYILDFVLIDTDVLPEVPKYFSELFEETLEPGMSQSQYELTGTWKLEEDYEFGSTTADVYLAQVGSRLSGVVIIHDVTADGKETIIQETILGTVEGSHFTLQGTNVRIIKGRYSEYELDRWTGVIKNNNEILGFSQDLAGTTGEFRMNRV